MASKSHKNKKQQQDADSIPDEIIGFFNWPNPSSPRNEYQETP
jgi:hypothetical protein